MPPGRRQEKKAGAVDRRRSTALTHEALRHAGRTVAFTAVTMTAGMLCFTATALRFVGEMAALLALWMVSSAATALVVLPALLVVIRPRFLVAGRDEAGR